MLKDFKKKHQKDGVYRFAANFILFGLVLKINITTFVNPMCCRLK